MTKPSIRPVTLIVADSGPLISLAVVDRLDLLQSFGRPVFVTDTVMHECTRLVDKPGASLLKEWFENVGGNQYRLIETPFGDAYLKAVHLSGGVPDSVKNFGEYSIHWALSNIGALAKSLNISDDEQFGLILAEDKAFFNSSPPPNTHMLSTRAFLVALENVGIIHNAENLRTAIKQSGRPGFAKSLIDRPHRSGNMQTDYQGNFLDENADRIRISKKIENENADQRSPRFK